jgi:ADP-heptose:LPS heptosyltransferase
MSSNSGKNEASPEAFRERFENAKTIGDVYNVFYDLQPHMKNAILAAKADANTKAEALFYYGVLAGSFYILLVAYLFAKDLSLVEREDFREDIMKIMMGVIDAYADLKKGKPLEDVKGTFDYLSWKILRDIREFAKNLEGYIKDLRPI